MPGTLPRAPIASLPPLAATDATPPRLPAPSQVLLLGDSAVGKTCLLMRFTDDKFSSQFISTVGVDFKSKVLPLAGERVKMQIWDTAGQERFRTISLSFLRGAQGIALCFDITDKKTFDHVESWMKQVKSQTEDIPMVLIANKCDLSEAFAIPRADVEAAAKAMGLAVFFTSAKTGESVAEAFAHLGTIAAEKAIKAKATKPPATGVVNLKDVSAAEEKKAACAC